MKRFVYIALFMGVLGVLAVGCASGKDVRYTPGEIQSFDQDTQDRIRAGELALNMTQPQVRLAWGAPDGVRTIPGESGGVREEWEYRSMLGAVRTYLYFDDGILTRLITGKPGMGHSDRSTPGGDAVPAPAPEGEGSPPHEK